MTEFPPILSIIIVNYNVKEYILNCIQSIQDKIDANRCPYEVIVSDNGSVDGSVEAIRERFPWVKVIENNANLGFGKANNIGAEQAEGEVLFFLNPDTLIIKGIEEMVEYVMEHKEVGIMGPVIYNANNKIDDTTSLIIYSPFKLFLSFYFYTYLKKQRQDITTYIRSQFASEVDSISGACILMRKNLFNDIKGFDEIFFFGMEDIDICIRIKQNGYTIKVFPLAEIVHLGGKAFIKVSDEISNRGAIQTCYFYKKHYPFSVLFVYLNIITFFLLRLFVSLIKTSYYRLSNDKTVLKERENIIHQSWIILKSYLTIKTIRFLFLVNINKIVKFKDGIISH